MFFESILRPKKVTTCAGSKHDFFRLITKPNFSNQVHVSSTFVRHCSLVLPWFQQNASLYRHVPGCRKLDSCYRPPGLPHPLPHRLYPPLAAARDPCAQVLLSLCLCYHHLAYLPFFRLTMFFLGAVAPDYLCFCPTDPKAVFGSCGSQDLHQALHFRP